MTAVTRFDAVDVATADARYGRLAYFREDDPIGASLHHYGEWAQVELDVLLRFVGSGDTVVDAGANVGTHTVAFAKAVGGAGRVLAFEPQPRVFELLERNVRSNGYDSVRCHRVALGAERSVRHARGLDYAAHVNVGAVSLLTAAAESSFSVEVVPLDSFDLDAVRLIKIDVEGMESDVLRGAAATLRRCRPFLSVECNSADAGAAILAALHGTEYALYLNRTPAYNPANHRANAMNRFGASSESSILCVPRELHDAVSALCAELPTLSPIARAEDFGRIFAGSPPADDSDELKRLQYRVAKHTFELAEADARAADEAARLAQIAARLAEAEAQLAEARSALAGAEAGRTEIEARLAAAEARSTEAEARHAEAEARRADAEARCSDAEARRADAEARHADAEARHAGAEARCADAEARCADAEARCASGEDRANAAVARADAERLRAESADNRAALLASAATGAHANVLRAEQRAAEAERRAVEAEQRAAELHEHATAAARCAVQLGDEVRARDALVASLVTSRSWRLTLPLRWVRRAFSRAVPRQTPGDARE
jgi:FkbM family methyltransferase